MRRRSAAGAVPDSRRPAASADPDSRRPAAGAILTTGGLLPAQISTAGGVPWPPGDVSDRRTGFPDGRLPQPLRSAVSAPSSGAPPPPVSVTPHHPRGGWFLAGARAAVGVPGLVLFASTVGFGGFAREAGLPLGLTLLMTGGIWALPSQIVLTGAIGAGSSIVAAFVAVSLSAVRLMPMTAAIMPLLRGPRTSRLRLLALSHFVAVTAWVLAMSRLQSLPREGRAPWFAGLGMALAAGSVAATGLGYWGAGELPPVLSGALVFMTPVYFLVSMTGAARSLTERLALAIGLVLTPLVGLFDTATDLLWGGLVGGTLAFLIGRFVGRAR
jgi:predicted branched-subunit amino acid permease